MADDLRSDDDVGGLEGHPTRPMRRSETQRRVVEREVPLGQQEQDNRVLAPAVHDWLDGALPEASVRKGDTARDVEFWKSVTAETDQRRHTRTPKYLEAQIMAALPTTAPQLITPWFRREFVVTPKRAVVAAVGFVAAGAAVAAAVMAAMR